MHQSTLVIRHPKLVALHTFWLQNTRGDLLPAAADLDPVDMRAWLGNLLIIDVPAAGQSEYTYAFYGRSFAESFGSSRIGQSLDHLPEAQRDILHAEYDRVRTEKAPVARVYTADFDGVTQTWERLVLPCSEEGAAVDKLLVGAYELVD